MNIKRAITTGAILAVVVAGVATATPGSGSTVTALAAGTFTGKIHVSQNHSADVQTVDVAFAPGGYTGWHSHPGPEVVTVKSGSVTFTRVRDGVCTTSTYGPGQGFVAYPQDTFIVRNASSLQTAEMVVILFDVPTGGANRIDRADPGIC
jgi:quercetin dioxygenase-like cupin family protein